MQQHVWHAQQVKSLRVLLSVILVGEAQNQPLLTPLVKIALMVKSLRVTELSAFHVLPEQNPTLAVLSVFRVLEVFIQKDLNTASHVQQARSLMTVPIALRV